jgi:predicted nuclease of predicted toxin-antitoxin system
MRILFDNGTPAPLRQAFENHTVVEAIERGWDRLVNGELIAAAETEGFDVLLTTDKNIRYQQNLTGRKIAFVVLGNQQWPTLRGHVERVLKAVEAATPGSYYEVEIPFDR